jgi:transposase InsO family protein
MSDTVTVEEIFYWLQTGATPANQATVARLVDSPVALDDAGVKRLPLPPRSPNLNAIAERFVRSVKEEAISRFILFGEKSLRHVLTEYLAHYHAERPHQGKGNVILVPGPRAEGVAHGPIECRERLGGTLKYYERRAA